MKKALFAYGSTQPLQVVGIFSAKAQVSPKQEVKNAEFIVFEGDGVPLTGEETATALGILKIGIPVNSVTIKEFQQDFEELFQGVGKLKDYQLKLQTDPKVKTVEQPMRRIPFNLREPLE
jgi:hypothetical protein